jgi:hypothetical protein
MAIWDVMSYDGSFLKLWRTGKDAFRVTQDGNYVSVLRHRNYSLVNKKFEDLFLLAHDQLDIHPVTIYDYQFKTEVKDYVELRCYNSISPQTIHTVENAGYRVWEFNGGIFVSQALKEELEKLPGNELRFAEGFSMWAGVDNSDSL